MVQFEKLNLLAHVRKLLLSWCRSSESVYCGGYCSATGEEVNLSEEKRGKISYIAHAIQWHQTPKRWQAHKRSQDGGITQERGHFLQGKYHHASVQHLWYYPEEFQLRRVWEHLDICSLETSMFCREDCFKGSDGVQDQSNHLPGKKRQVRNAEESFLCAGGEVWKTFQQQCHQTTSDIQVCDLHGVIIVVVGILSSERGLQIHLK